MEWRERAAGKYICVGTDRECLAGSLATGRGGTRADCKGRSQARYLCLGLALLGFKAIGSALREGPE